MGNCGTHTSATDESDDIKNSVDLPCSQLNQYDIELQQKIAKYGGYPELYRPPIPFAATDPSFDPMMDADTVSDMPSVHSNTPSSGIRPKSYIKQSSYDSSRAHGSASPVGYRAGGSIASETRHLRDQRPGSASHLVRYGVSQNNYSPSANSSLSYGYNGHPAEIRDRRPSPTVLQTQYRTHSAMEKYAQKMAAKPVQQKYLVHHSLNKPHSPKTISSARSESAQSHYFSRKNSSKYFVAIFDYQAHCDEDLTVHKGDVVILLDHRCVSIIDFF